jgi:IS30 family transposase
MNKNTHLTLDDRLEIQLLLKKGENFTWIADSIGKNPTTIAREVKAHRYLSDSSTGNDCIYRNECNLPSECLKRGIKCSPYHRSCRIRCKICRIGCEHYEKEHCNMYDKAPYVCSSCEIKSKCRLDKMVYDAKHAQTAYETMRRESRQGISLSEEELQYLDDTVSKLIKQGQSIPVVWESHKGEMPVSARTLYTYIDSGLLNARNLDLRRKVRMPYRKKSGPVLRVDKQCHINRTFDDFNRYIAENPDVVVSQMDTVEGRKGGKVILTILFTNCGLQLMFLRERNTAASVINVFNYLKHVLSDEQFKRLFQAILADRGSEFTDPKQIETDMDTGEVMCRLFYCDPMNSNQKANCEKNHSFIRYIIPKGTSMDHLSQNDITKMMNHINSYPRKKWNGQSPVDIFIKIYGQEITSQLGLAKIPPESITLTPDLLR